MVKKLLIMMLSVLSVFVMALEDVNRQDASYKAIKRGVEQGYFSTYENGQKFFPDRPITRRELALILDQLILSAESNQPLTVTERQELGQLAKTFKSYLVQQKLGATQVGQKFTELNSDQDVLHHDLTSLQLQVNELKAENKAQKQWLWAALGLAAVGIIAK